MTDWPVTDWDDAFANTPHIPGGALYPERWEAASAEHRSVEQALGRAMLNLSYGTGPRDSYDLFFPAGRPEGLVVFLHGGFWLDFDKGFWSHLAAGPTARGWAVAMPSYPLAPAARIAQITRAAAMAVTSAAARIAGPVVITGHSAGGHLAARLACADVGLPVADRVARVVPISPLSDLRPLLLTGMNADLSLDAAEAAAESPALLPPPSVPVHVWVGADERPAFRDQAQALAVAWDAPLTVEAGRHHFDVIEGLAEAESPLTRALLGG